MDGLVGAGEGHAVDGRGGLLALPVDVGVGLGGPADEHDGRDGGAVALPGMGRGGILDELSHVVGDVGVAVGGLGALVAPVDLVGQGVGVLQHVGHLIAPLAVGIVGPHGVDRDVLVGEGNGPNELRLVEGRRVGLGVDLVLSEVLVLSPSDEHDLAVLVGGAGRDGLLGEDGDVARDEAGLRVGGPRPVVCVIPQGVLVLQHVGNAIAVAIVTPRRVNGDVAVHEGHLVERLGRLVALGIDDRVGGVSPTDEDHLHALPLDDRVVVGGLRLGHELRLVSAQVEGVVLDGGLAAVGVVGQGVGVLQHVGHLIAPLAVGIVGPHGVDRDVLVGEGNGPNELRLVEGRRVGLGVDLVLSEVLVLSPSDEHDLAVLVGGAGRDGLLGEDGDVARDEAGLRVGGPRPVVCVIPQGVGAYIVDSNDVGHLVRSYHERRIVFFQNISIWVPLANAFVRIGADCLVKCTGHIHCCVLILHAIVEILDLILQVIARLKFCNKISAGIKSVDLSRHDAVFLRHSCTVLEPADKAITILRRCL